MKLFCIRQVSNMASTCSALGRGTTSSITPPKDEVKDSKQKRSAQRSFRQSLNDFKSDVDDDVLDLSYSEVVQAGINKIVPMIKDMVHVSSDHSYASPVQSQHRILPPLINPP